MSIKGKLKNSIFGQNIIYCNKVEISYRLSDLVINNGFSDFDLKGITSFLTFRYPIGDLTMFKNIGKFLEKYWSEVRYIGNWLRRLKSLLAVLNPKLLYLLSMIKAKSKKYLKNSIMHLFNKRTYLS